MLWHKRRTEVVDSKSCSKLTVGTSSAKAPSLGSSQAAGDWGMSHSSARGGLPLSGLVVCVTGLSREARKQVMDATQRLGGDYSPTLHPRCTHLVVQGCGGRKFEHALKHGPKNGLFVVTLGWFVDSVRSNARMKESLYCVRPNGESPLPRTVELNRPVHGGGSCLPTALYEESGPSFGRSNNVNNNLYAKEARVMTTMKSGGGPIFANDYVYVDPHISTEMRTKIVDALVDESAQVLDCWFAGCCASYVVCDGSQVCKYVGHAGYIVSPSWIFKSLREKERQRLVHLSIDIAREMSVVLENAKSNHQEPANFREILIKRNAQDTVEERRKAVDLAKLAIRSRRVHRMQFCQMRFLPITPTKILDSICWCISEPTSSAGIYMESCVPEDAESHRADQKETVASAENQIRPLKESEKLDVVFRSHFLTILFPIDRFGEIGPSSRTFFREGGFSCIHVLEHVYNFYQENMTADEVAVAIHTDSRHGDRLRSLFATKESIDRGLVPFKRIDFLGSRKSFEMLKRSSGENSNVYELLIGA